MRTIVVKGTGNVKTKPDTVESRLELSARDMDYQKAVEREAQKLEQLQEVLSKAGIPKKDMKTTHYGVRARHERTEGKNNEYVFLGFDCDQNCYFRFKYTKKKLDEVLTALAGCAAGVEFSIHFTVKDREAIKDQLLKEAVKNSAKRAGILADAAGVKLGEIQDISYNWGEIDVYSNFSMSKGLMMGDASQDICLAADMEPDDIETADTVTIVWELVT